MPLKRFLIATPAWDSGTVVASHNKALAEALARRGHGVSIVISGKTTATDADMPGCSVFRWPSSRPIFLRDFKWIRAHMRCWRPDGVIAHFGAVNAVVFAAFLQKVKARVAWYHTPTGMVDADGKLPAWFVKLLRIRKRWFYRMATHLVPVSRSAESDLCKSYSVAHRRCRVFYNSLSDPLSDVDTVFSDSTPAIESRVVCAGRLNPTKGQDLLIKAVALLKRRGMNVHVDIVGHGPTRASLEKLAASEGVVDLVHFIGGQTHSQVLSHLRRAAVSVVPSRVDAGSLTLMESMAVGVPVLVARAGSAPEIAVEGVEAMMFDEDSPHSLAQKLGEMLHDPSLRASISSAGRRRFLSQFEQAAALEEQVAWLESITES